MGPPKPEVETSNSSIFHGSKSESNLFRSFTNGLNGATSLQSSLNGADQEQVFTSTFSTSDNNFQTPVRGTTLFPKNGARRFQRSSSHIGGNCTPSSGPRTNPFDSQLSMDRLHLPTCSPSVFSIVVSPSQVLATHYFFLYKCSLLHSIHFCFLGLVNIWTILVLGSTSKIIPCSDIR